MRVESRTPDTMLARWCAKLSGRGSSRALTSPLLLDDDDDDGGGIIRRNVVQLPKTFQLPDINMKHVVVRPQDDEQEELDYSIHDDVELEYMTTRVFLRHQLLTEWTSPSKTKDKDKDEDEDEDEEGEEGRDNEEENIENIQAQRRHVLIDEQTSRLLPTLSDATVEAALREAGRAGKLKLRQVDVQGCFHCELPHQGFRPLLWDILLWPTTHRDSPHGTELRVITEEERELIGLDAARTRFSDQLIGDGTEANDALSRVLLAWLSSLPPDAEYRQGADSLAAVVLSVVGRASSDVSKQNNSGGNNSDSTSKDQQGETKNNNTNANANTNTNTNTNAYSKATIQLQDVEKTSSQLMGRLVYDFVPGYFFRGDTKFLQDQLAKVRLVLWFWDPELAIRLFDQLQIAPAMFAVPWFITLFADVWPFDRVAYVWDALFSVGPPLLTFLAVAVLRAKRKELLRVEDENETFQTTGYAFSSCMQLFSRLNSGERKEMPNVRWCVLKALSMYHQMPTAVVNSLEHDHRNEHERHRKYSRQSWSKNGINVIDGSVTENNSQSCMVVDIERDRRVGIFSRLKIDDVVGSVDNDREQEEDEEGLVVCEPPQVAWSDVSQWVMQQSCITVDLRHCTAAQHHWLVQRYDGGYNNAMTPPPPRRPPQRRKKKGKKQNTPSSSQKRTSFLHVPFVPKDVKEATKILTNLTILVREWYVQNGYVVLVTWEGEQSVIPVASALMRAGVPRVCHISISSQAGSLAGSLLSGGRSSASSTSPRSQRRWKRNLRRSLSETNGPLVL